MMKIRTLTAAEEQLMLVVWQINSGYMRDIIAEYPEPKPHPNTVSTFLKILVEKEFLNTVREGRIFRYTAAIPHADYRKFLLEDLLLHHFDNNVQSLIDTLDPDGSRSSEKVDQPTHPDSSKPDSTSTAEDITALVKKITKKKKKKKDGQPKLKKKKNK